MNTQLTLIDPSVLTHKEETVRSPHQKNVRITKGSGDWWKLSREEKQQGLAGVRAIRAILQKRAPEDDISLAKAS